LLHPTIPVTVKVYGGRAPAINRAWIDALMMSANSSSGLSVVPEPAEVSNS
jgi:hypothetical protein